MAIVPQRVAGIIAVTIDGVAYVVRGKCSYRCNQVTRETIKGQSGVVGYKEVPQAGRISFNLSDSGGISVALLNSLTASTVTAQLANGKGVTGTGMWVVEDQDVDTEEGSFDCAFEGPLVEEFSL
jgi:hypothetical protein